MPCAADPVLRVDKEWFVVPKIARASVLRLDRAIVELKGSIGQPQMVRLRSLGPSRDRPNIVLYALDIETSKDHWAPVCEPDHSGMRAGFPVAGEWTGHGAFVADRSKWFLTCSSGARGKCILWGYDPWSRGPHGESLVPYYEACVRMVRADYTGSGSHTREGVSIRFWDDIGVWSKPSDEDRSWIFEAGWMPKGTACAATVRRPELLSFKQLMRAAPALGGKCDPAIAHSKGAILLEEFRR